MTKTAIAKAVMGVPPLHIKGWLRALAILSAIASCISMAILYQDPFAHISLCFGGTVPVEKDAGLVFFGHCAWCYLAVGFGLAALIAPGKHPMATPHAPVQSLNR